MITFVVGMIKTEFIAVGEKTQKVRGGTCRVRGGNSQVRAEFSGHIFGGMINTGFVLRAQNCG